MTNLDGRTALVTMAVVRDRTSNCEPREMFRTSHRGEPPLGALWRPTRVGPSDLPRPAQRYWVHEVDEKIN